MGIKYICLPLQEPGGKQTTVHLAVEMSQTNTEDEGAPLNGVEMAADRPSRKTKALIMALVAITLGLLLMSVPRTWRQRQLEARLQAEESLARAVATPAGLQQNNESDDDDEVQVGEYKDEGPTESSLKAKHRSDRPFRQHHRPAAVVTNTTEWAKSHVARFRPDLSQMADAPIREAYAALVKEYLAPWTGIGARPGGSKGVGRVPVTKRMLNVMEYAYKGGSFRVRISNGKIWYRKIVHWKQTYRTQRMLWYLKLLHEMVRKDKMVRKDVDFIIYVGDGAKVAADTFTTEAGFPLFSLRTSVLHMDIPIPDPVSHGSNGHYLWTEAGKTVPWDSRVSQLVFRGKGSCLKMQADNWHACDRVRAQKLSDAFPEEIDAGIIEWNQLHKSSRMIYPPVAAEEVERSTGLKAAKSMDFTQQSRYKYILDLDGGLGSSRKPGILSSGSVLFAQESPWYTYYEPLMEPYKHYVPINRWLHDLRDQVLWARDNDDAMRAMVDVERAFERKYLTVASTKLYMSILLDAYAELLTEPVNGSEPVERDYCQLMENMEIRNGPMGCSREWLLFTGELPDEIRNDGRDQI